MSLHKLIGLNILKFKGYVRVDSDIVTPDFALMDDECTIISFVVQDKYTYHDYNDSARSVVVIRDSTRWDEINESQFYADPNIWELGY